MSPSLCFELTQFLFLLTTADRLKMGILYCGASRYPVCCNKAGSGRSETRRRNTDPDNLIKVVEPPPPPPPLTHPKLVTTACLVNKEAGNERESATVKAVMLVMVVAVVVAVVNVCEKKT